MDYFPTPEENKSINKQNSKQSGVTLRAVFPPRLTHIATAPWLPSVVVGSESASLTGASLNMDAGTIWTALCTFQSTILGIMANMVRSYWVNVSR